MSERPVLDQINLVVSDMAASIEFYRRLGVEISDAPPPWDTHHRTAVTGNGIDLDLDSETFAAKWNAGHVKGSTRPVIGFRVSTREAVDELHAGLIDAGAMSQAAPYDTFWGSRYAIVTDPDDNPVGIMSPPDPERRSAPPDPAS